MSLTKKTLAFIIILITSLPMVMIANNGPEVLTNFIGIAYAWLYFKFGPLIAPRFVKDYLALLDEEAKKTDEEWE